MKRPRIKTYTIHQAKSQLSKLIQKALRGEEVVITNQNTPLVRLSVIRPLKRRLGFLGKDGWISPNFNAPLKEFKTYQ